MNEKDLISITNIVRYEVIETLITKYKDIELNNLNIIERVADDILVVLNRIGEREDVKEMIK
tara:strand:- start:517 stop:702 length:186 start_codon:yes stop_codon:yes gene_type:complete